mmetsp:Transcript_46671/g.91836  ORF Transcript_46671/g.91836 Transcript_46671/m.91836 type:complete len:112 (-) Transcript_46671:439-774(-)
MDPLASLVDRTAWAGPVSHGPLELQVLAVVVVVGVRLRHLWVAVLRMLLRLWIAPRQMAEKLRDQDDVIAAVVAVGTAVAVCSTRAAVAYTAAVLPTAVGQLTSAAAAAAA